MAGEHVASLASQLQQQLAQRSAGGGAGFFTSPASLYVALALALNGTGARGQCIATAACLHCMHARLQATLCSLCPAGPGSTCQQQLLQLLRPAAPGSSDAQGDVECLSAQLSELLASLAAQSGDGGCELIVANGVWTKQVEVLPGYAADMARLFKVCGGQLHGACVH